MTGHQMAAFYLLQRGRLFGTDSLGVKTARVKLAGLRWIERSRHLSRKYDFLPYLRRVGRQGG
jgi:hypothetical protein